jgi:hypothetical protein
MAKTKTATNASDNAYSAPTNQVDRLATYWNVRHDAFVVDDDQIHNL